MPKDPMQPPDPWPPHRRVPRSAAAAIVAGLGAVTLGLACPLSPGPLSSGLARTGGDIRPVDYVLSAGARTQQLSGAREWSSRAVVTSRSGLQRGGVVAFSGYGVRKAGALAYTGGAALASEHRAATVRRSGESYGCPSGSSGTRTPGASFAASSQADLVKITLLDPGAGLTPLSGVRLADAQSKVDTAGTPSKAVATARYADAKLLGMQLTALPPDGSSAVQQAPGDDAGPDGVSLAKLDAGGLATVQAGKSTAEAHWVNGYRCGATGPLTRAGTLLTGVQLLSGNRVLQGGRTGLLRIAPTGSTQSAADLVALPGNRVGVSAGAGVVLGDITLFAGTPQEISIKVITQPTLTVVAGGSRAASRVGYRAPVLQVTAAGKPATTLDADNDSLGLQLPGAAVKVSLGGPDERITDGSVTATAASVRLQISLTGLKVLDVALGYLSASASAEPMACEPEPSTTKRGHSRGR